MKLLTLRSFLQSPVTSLFGPNIFLSTPFSNTHNLCPPLNIRDQVSHPYRTTSKIIVLYKLGICRVEKPRKRKDDSVLG
jgi:hypothetical protein